jgi:opacity protein-like surface antigen
MLGHQFMDDEFWGPVDDQAVIGFETAFETEGDVVGGEVGFAVASPQGEENIVDPIQGAGEFEVELDYYELYSGLHRTFLRGTRIQPYVGAGLSIIWWDAEKRFNAPGQAEREDEDDNFAFGAYVHGGLSIQLTENLQVGLDLRALYGTDVEDLFGAGDLDYQRIALFIGFGD